MNTEDDEFDRIEREQEMRKGQPYIWEADAIKAAVLIEREECARIAEKQLNWGTALAIRARNDTSSKRVDITEEHKHDN
jgi:hypothetical protein